MTVITDLPEEQYHDGSHFGIHALSDIGKYGPRGFYDRHIGKTVKQPDRQAFAFGRAAHCYILEGREAFEKRFWHQPLAMKWDLRTKACKEIKAENEGTGKLFVSLEDMDLIRAMSSNIHGSQAGDILNYGKPEVSIRREERGVPVQIRMDWYDESKKRIVDLKTIDSIDNIEKQVKNFGYRTQAAWYSMMYEWEFGCYPEWIFLFVEKANPHRVAIVRLDEDAIELGARESLTYLDSVAHHLNMYGRDKPWPNPVIETTLGLSAWERKEIEE